MTAKKGWIGVDLDATLAHYDHWRGIEHIGEPVASMLDRVTKLLAEGIEVRVFTARVCHDGTPEGFGEAMRAKAVIQDWCEKHIGHRLEVTNQKDFAMVTLFDDRCRQVVANKGEVVGETTYP